MQHGQVLVIRLTIICYTKGKCLDIRQFITAINLQEISTSSPVTMRILGRVLPSSHTEELAIFQVRYNYVLITRTWLLYIFSFARTYLSIALGYMIFTFFILWTRLESIGPIKTSLHHANSCMHIALAHWIWLNYGVLNRKMQNIK